MDRSPINLVSICSGVGWLDIGVSEALRHCGVHAKTVAYVERDAYAATVLLSRMEEEVLESAPVWCGDMREFPVEQFHGMVDGICAGFPCQDISYAGRGDGIRGERSGLWFNVLETAVQMGCSYLFLENVAAITTRGLDAVLGSLADAGFDAEWLCLQAAEVSAPHKRDRWFCLADAPSKRRFARGTEPEVQQRTTGVTEYGGKLGDAKSWSGCGEALFPPGPSDFDEWNRVTYYRAPAVKPGLRVLADGRALVVDESREDQLRCSGNGVVALQAAAAFVELIRRAGCVTNSKAGV